MKKKKLELAMACIICFYFFLKKTCSFKSLMEAGKLKTIISFHGSLTIIANSREKSSMIFITY